MINNSLWLKGMKYKRKETLTNDLHTDVLIIGGGMTGISTAYHLRNSGSKIVVIDQNKVGYGVSAYTTGKLTFLQGDIYQKIETAYDSSFSDLYLKSQLDAIELVKSIIVSHGIKCHFESNCSYVFTNRLHEVMKIKKLESFLKRNNIEYKVRPKLPVKFPSLYGIKVDGTAVFHPIQYLMELKEICLESGVSIYEGAKATSFEKTSSGYLVNVNGYTIYTKKLVIACHYPFFITPGLFPFKTYLEKSFVLAGIVERGKKFNAITIGKEAHSIRYHHENQNYIIYAAESEKISKNINNEKKYQDILWKMQTNLTTNVKYGWFNYDIMTLDSLPFIGYLEEGNERLLIATGYNTWGMTNGSLAGKILSDLILDKKNPYSALFSPNRKINIVTLFKLLNYNFNNSKSFLISKFITDYSFYPANVKIIEKNGIRYGVYTDEKEKEHIVYNKCPHMKCNLIFNDTDKTWDCPCHGSRFDIQGNAIKGPSAYSIKVDKSKL